jgi:hypothetical protein
LLLRSGSTIALVFAYFKLRAGQSGKFELREPHGF